MAGPAEKTVLVVDDEEDVRFFLQSVLEDAGYKVETAADGEEALEKARANPPDVISLDLVMPRKSGAMFHRELRRDEALQHIPVVLVTAHAKDDVGKKDFDEIMSGGDVQSPETYLEKPVSAETYLDCVGRALDSENVKTFVTPKGGKTPDGGLKEQLKDLIDGADEEKLQEALRLLKKQDS